MGSDNPLPITEEMTTAEVYKAVMNENNNSYDLAKKDVEAIKTSYSYNSQKSLRNLNKKFLTLPNPQIPVYVFPHYAKSGDEFIPVIGYTTAFHMYKQHQLAMLGERY